MSIFGASVAVVTMALGCSGAPPDGEDTASPATATEAYTDENVSLILGCKVGAIEPYRGPWPWSKDYYGMEEYWDCPSLPPGQTYKAEVWIEELTTSSGYALIGESYGWSVNPLQGTLGTANIVPSHKMTARTLACLRVSKEGDPNTIIRSGGCLTSPVVHIPI
jgi:hypothetical protein